VERARVLSKNRSLWILLMGCITKRASGWSRRKRQEIDRANRSHDTVAGPDCQPDRQCGARPAADGVVARAGCPAGWHAFTGVAGVRMLARAKACSSGASRRESMPPCRGNCYEPAGPPRTLRQANALKVRSWPYISPGRLLSSASIPPLLVRTPQPSGTATYGRQRPPRAKEQPSLLPG